MTIVVGNQGTFEIPNEKVQELIQWLEQNSVKLQENTNTQNYGGDVLLNG